MADAIDLLLARTLEAVGDERRFPVSTYRLQFHGGFTFRDACRLVPYLSELGITHCYASPYLRAQPGSQHGYDITDHNALNPEIGTEEDYTAWVAALRQHGMGQILDTVPNHMGILGNENAWWNDILENGPSSPYASFFDIAWQASPRPELQNKVLLPILGDPYGKVLDSQQLRLEYAAGSFFMTYFEHRFPVSPSSYGRILGHRLEELERSLEPAAPPLVEYHSILTAVKHLPALTETAADKITERQREKEVIKRRLAALTQDSALVLQFIEETVALFNGTAGNPHSFDPLDQLLSEQAYRLSYWRVASDEINYRRFFDINALAALNMEREDVFAATHALVLRLLWEGKVSGLRIDHPDGLYDPKKYLQRLQVHFLLGRARQVFSAMPEFAAEDWTKHEAAVHQRLDDHFRQPASGNTPNWPLYVVVEKILGANETLPMDWPSYGTSGYEFLNMLNGLFVETRNGRVFTQLYQDWTHDDTPYLEVVFQKKFLILQVALSSELHILAHQLDRLAQKNRWSRDFTLNSLRHTIREFITCFPAYRSYISEEGVHESDRKHVLWAFKRARSRNPVLSPALFQFVRDMLLLHYPEGATDADKAEQLRFAGKFQQVTAPVMAKGLEDTAFYVYNRFLSLNDVGGDPGQFGLAPAMLHRFFQDRQARWPWALSTTSTHDTKRSEDVRARLNVLSELPDEWREALERWRRLNEAQRIALDEETSAPDANEEYFLYQTLLGAWPLPPYAAADDATFVRRIQDYMVKALHEAKVHTSWINPDAAYDNAVRQFVERILDPQVSAPFLDDLRAVQKRLAHHGLLNGLAQTLLKIAAPGVPDIYQGNEVWDFSLVDPDNRRPVDFARRVRMLRELQARGDKDRRDLASELVRTKEDGRIKMYVIYRALHCRRAHPELFTIGNYLPLQDTGVAEEHVFGFVRQEGEECALVVVPRLLTHLVQSDQAPLGSAVWQDAKLSLPGSLAKNSRWRNVFTGEVIETQTASEQPTLALADVFAHFPVALLLAER